SLVNSPRAVPLGSVLDVSGGWALIVTAAPYHRTHSVAAHGAKVRITQRRSESGLTQLRLVSQDSRGCRTGRLARPIHYRDKLTLKTRRYHRRTRRSAADPGVFRSVGSDETAE